MLIKRYVSTASNIFAENRLLKFVIFMLFLTLMFLVYQNNKIAKSYKIVLVPPNLNQKVTVYNDMIDDKYAEAMGFYIANLLFSFNSRSIDVQYDTVFGMLDSGIDKKITEEMRTAKLKYKENNIDSILRIESIKIDPSAKIIKVIGEIQKYVFEKPLQKEKLNLNIYYKIENGLFYITNIGIKES